MVEWCGVSGGVVVVVGGGGGGGGGVRVGSGGWNLVVLAVRTIRRGPVSRMPSAGSGLG